MAQIDSTNIGTVADDGTGDTPRAAFRKVNKLIIDYNRLHLYNIELAEMSLLDGSLWSTAEANMLVGIGGTTLANQLAAKLTITDTTAMILPYLRKGLAATTYATLANSALTGTTTIAAMTVESNTIDFGDVTEDYVLTFNASTNTWAGEAAGGGSMVYPDAGIALSTGSAWGTSITNNSTNWNTAYTDRLKWDGGATGLVAGTARTSLSLENVTNESKATMFTSPTLTGTVTIPTPFTLGAVSVTSTGTQLNYLNTATGTTGTNTTNLVYSTSPVFTTPNIGVATGSVSGNAGTVTNGVYTTDNLSVFSATSSAQLAGILSNETGSGLSVFGTSPTLVTPALGTPSALVGTNISGTAASLTAGTVTGFTPASGSLTLAGADALTITTTAATGVTLPTSGTLATTTQVDLKANALNAVFAGTHTVAHLTVGGGEEIDSIPQLATGELAAFVGVDTVPFYVPYADRSTVTPVEVGDEITLLDGTAWRVFYTDGSGDMIELALGANGTYFESNGAAAAPTFTTPGGGGDLLAANNLSELVSDPTAVSNLGFTATVSEINTPLDGASVTLAEFQQLEAVGATTISAAQWTGLGGATAAGIALWDDAAATDQLVTLGINATASEINTPLDGATVTLTEFQELETIGATTISANQWAALGGIAETLTSTELDYVDGTTSNIQTQLTAKPDLADVFTLADFGAGIGLAGDTALITAALNGYGNYYRKEDSTIITEIITNIPAGDTVNYSVVYNDTLWSTAVTCDTIATIAADGGETLTTSFDVSNIPEDMYIWIEMDNVVLTRKPIKFRSKILGYIKRD